MFSCKTFSVHVPLSRPATSVLILNPHSSFGTRQLAAFSSSIALAELGIVPWVGVVAIRQTSALFPTCCKINEELLPQTETQKEKRVCAYMCVCVCVCVCEGGCSASLALDELLVSVYDTYFQKVPKVNRVLGGYLFKMEHI